jgi:hypothetical protein
MACCLQCRAEFKIRRFNQFSHPCPETRRLMHNERMLVYNRKRGIVGKSGVRATCLCCHEEFICRPDRKQRNHGCKESLAEARKEREAVYGKGATPKTVWQKKREQELKNIRIKDNLHPCPKCGAPTANHYRCDRCWGKMDDVYDVDAFVTFNSGYARRLTRPIFTSSWN